MTKRPFPTAQATRIQSPPVVTLGVDGNQTVTVVTCEFAGERASAVVDAAAAAAEMP